VSYPRENMVFMHADIVRLAESQHAVFTRAQALDHGISADTIDHWVHTGRLSGKTDGVYRVPGAPETWHQSEMALVLAAGPGAAASHRAAAFLERVPGFWLPTPEVTSPRPRRHRTTEGIVHRSRVLPEHHLIVVDGIRVTCLARTLFDLAGVLRNPAQVERALDNCIADRRVTTRQIGDMVGELGKRGRKGTRLMRELLLARGEGYVATASELEARFVKLCRKFGIPEAVRQQNTGDADKWIARVDFAYPPPLRIIIELDGRRHWLSMLDHESDLVRDAKLTAAGWRVIHFTWHHLTQEPDFVVATLRQLLATAAA
jgi:very-short-patch-repair endonuclease